MMSIDERKAEILRVLNDDSTVRAGALAARFGVSEDTIRRDLRSLADAGLLRRVYGGAVAPAQTSQIFADRLQESVAAKSGIAKAAAALVRPGQTIALDSGTTVAGLAACLPSDVPLTVITHSLPAAMALVEKPLIEVVVLGGKLLAKSAAMMGPEVVAGYAKCRADVCFLGVTSVDPEAGITVYDYENAEVKRAMIASAEKVAVLAAADKLGTSTAFVVGPTTAIDWLVTDAGPDSPKVRELEARGVDVITV